MKPCIVCGGPKERGHQGSRICDTCRFSEERKEFLQKKESDRSKNRWYQEVRRRNNGAIPRRLKIRNDGFVWCKRCEDYLHPEKFNKVSNKNRGFSPGNHHPYSSYCSVCQKIYNRSRRLQLLYGLDLEDYEKILKFQNNVCYICQRNDFRYSLAVDHNHNTGEVRGLLCKGCNRDLLGALHDNIDALKRAIDYLENPPTGKMKEVGISFNGLLKQAGY